MNYQKITKFDTANGPGIREVLWVSGCDHHCEGCHNPQTWDYNSGKPFTIETIDEIIKDLNEPFRAGITLSGGDPLSSYNCETILYLVLAIRKIYNTDKTIWCYTGYKWEEVKHSRVVQLMDVLVDGEYEQEHRDISLPYCGSTNQRVIDVQKSLQQNTVVLWENSNL